MLDRFKGYLLSRGLKLKVDEIIWKHLLILAIQIFRNFPILNLIPIWKTYIDLICSTS